MSTLDGYTALYAADVSVLADPQLYAAAYAAASPARREKTDRYRFAKDRYLSLGAEMLLHHALHSAGIRELPATFNYGAQGKPYLEDGGVYFNISHSGNWALCAVSVCEVGCDVEKIAPIDLKIAERFFFRGEYDDIAAQTTQEAQNEMFYRYWTLKESFMKATGLGMKLPLDAFRVVLGSEISVEQSVDGRNYRFTEYDEIPGCKCALCTAGACRTAELCIMDLRKILAAIKTTELLLDVDPNELKRIREAIFSLPLPRTKLLNLQLAAEECFVNICSYAFGGRAPADEKVRFTLSLSDRIEMCFADGGQKYNPLENIAVPDDYDPDTQIGGLGKLISFSIADDVAYEYRDGKNILTLIKYIEEDNQ